MIAIFCFICITNANKHQQNFHTPMTLKRKFWTYHLYNSFLCTLKMTFIISNVHIDKSSAHWNVYKEDKDSYFFLWTHTSRLNIFHNIKIPFEKKTKSTIEIINYHKHFLLHVHKKIDLQLQCIRTIVSCIKISFSLICMGRTNTYNRINYGIVFNCKRKRST
jgi:hypothetical protein